jgi:uncharacterized protein
MLMNADQVATYLRDHPKFFEDYAPLLADVHIPHPHGGRAISISERQILSLREKNKILEGKLAELIKFGEENDGIGDKLHALCVALLAAPDFDATLDALYGALRERFSIPRVALRLWNIAPDRADRPEFAAAAPELRQFVATMPGPHCGQHSVYEVHRWFGEIAPHLRSFALMPLKHAQAFGLLVLGSEDAQRFYAEMGTLHLKRLGELVSAAIAARLRQ